MFPITKTGATVEIVSSGVLVDTGSPQIMGPLNTVIVNGVDVGLLAEDGLKITEPSADSGFTQVVTLKLLASEVVMRNNDYVPARPLVVVE